MSRILSAGQGLSIISDINGSPMNRGINIILHNDVSPMSEISSPTSSNIQFSLYHSKLVGIMMAHNSVKVMLHAHDRHRGQKQASKQAMKQRATAICIKSQSKSIAAASYPNPKSNQLPHLHVPSIHTFIHTHKHNPDGHSDPQPPTSPKSEHSRQKYCGHA